MTDVKKMQQLDRIRKDLIQRTDKKFDKITVAVTDTKSVHADRKENEVWEDHNGKKWTRRNGIVQSISKFEGLRTPYWCPKCTKSMNHRLDDKFYRLHGFCMECTLKWHTQMKLDGTFDAYERHIMRENEKAFLNEKIQEHEDYIRTFRTPQQHYGDGRWEELASKSLFEGTFDEVRADIEFCKARLEQITNEELSEQVDL